MRKLLVNADDLGYNAPVNRAVIESLVSGSCSSATLMANMPGFEEACELAHQERVAERVGVHWVLTEGTPLSEPIRQCRRFCDGNGQLALKRSRGVYRLNSEERAALAEELMAQLKRCRDAGINPRHADTHHHSHAEWPIAEVVMRLCVRERITALRLSRNIGIPGGGIVRTLYKQVLNRWIRRRGLAQARYFGGWMDYRYALSSGQMGIGDVEIMVHPGWGRDGELIDMTCGLPLCQLRREICAPG